MGDRSYRTHRLHIWAERIRSGPDIIAYTTLQTHMLAVIVERLAATLGLSPTAEPNTVPSRSFSRFRGKYRKSDWRLPDSLYGCDSGSLRVCVCGLTSSAKLKGE